MGDRTPVSQREFRPSQFNVYVPTMQLHRKTFVIVACSGVPVEMFGQQP
jgi:hypothetical protein